MVDALGRRKDLDDLFQTAMLDFALSEAIGQIVFITTSLMLLGHQITCIIV